MVPTIKRFPLNHSSIERTLKSGATLERNTPHRFFLVSASLKEYLNDLEKMTSRGSWLLKVTAKLLVYIGVETAG